MLGSFLLREFTSIRYEIHSYKRKYGTVSVCLSINIDSDKASLVVLYRGEVVMMKSHKKLKFRSKKKSK